jgi:hypothetical protein
LPVSIVGKTVKAQCASMVLARCRLLFFPYYPRFTRFEAKLFLFAVLEYFDGVPQMCIIDNNHPNNPKPGCLYRPLRPLSEAPIGPVQIKGGGPADTEGRIEFIAHYTEKQVRKRHHELAHFHKIDGRWYFYDGSAPKIRQHVREHPKVGRNDPCPCGSGLKYKRCCGR